MGSLSGFFQRPALAVSAMAIASVSVDFYDKSSQVRQSSDDCSSSLSQMQPSSSFHGTNSSWVSQISMSKLTQLSFITKIHTPIPNIHRCFFSSIPNSKLHHSLVSSPTILFNSVKSADLLNSANPVSYHYKASSSSPSDVLYQWHLPDPNAIDSSFADNSKTVVVLLGWLGSKQKHLGKYAEWYTSRGFNAISFTFPMSEVLSYQVGGKAEQDVMLLVNHLAEWMEEEDGKNLVFHTFSNTGWLTYGVILEKLQEKDSTLAEKIKGCIVDSAPVAAPDPQVWACGFSAAFLKKNSVATKPSSGSTRTTIEVKPAVTETLLLAVLEKIFGAVLGHPSINRRLSEVVSVLTTEQPPSCPQLYIYSSADRVIPARSVESFVEKQRRSGRSVRACDFVSSPHVDHFRNRPELYSSQLQQFLDDCMAERNPKP
ncbi:hypothetical protein M569_15817, partial [Genlisea aurea]